jgi:prepilin-type processing-associated H-X9-DG protein
MKLLSASSCGRSGFTRADLLAVVGVVTLAGLLGLPLLAQPLRHSRTALCFENLRALMTGAFRHAEDHGGRLPPNPTGSFGSTNVWSGPNWLDLTASPANTNVATGLARGALWPYMDGNAAAYRCPEDFTGRATPGGGFAPRVRSYSMSSFMGNATGWTGTDHFRWRTFTNVAALTQPDALWVFIEERPDSINDGLFAVDMTGYPDRPASFRMVDYPSFYHARGSVLAFADGHAQHRQWRDARTVPPYTGSFIQLNRPHPNSPDVAWINGHATVPK